MADSVGFTVPETQMRIVDIDGAEVTQGEIGEIEVSGPSVFTGYWDAPDMTATALTDDNFFKTGDLGTQDEDGRFSLAGRTIDRVITANHVVYPEEIELVIGQIDNVNTAAVLGLPHPELGQALLAFITTSKDFNDTEFKIQITETLDPTKQPVDVVLLETLPKDSLGRIDKAQLYEAYETYFGSGQ